MSESNSAKTIAVTGATGFVGRHVIREILSRGWAVRALVRDRAKAAAVLPADKRVSLIQGEVFDPRILADLFADSNAAVNTIGIAREAPGTQTFQRLHVDTVKALTDACRSADTPVTRFIHVSALGVGPDGKAEYQRSKFAGEQIVRRSGLEWTILRPGLIHGPGSQFIDMVRQWCSGTVPPFFFIPYFTRRVEHDEGVPMGRISFEAARIAPVLVHDVARAAAEAIARPASVGEVYNLVGPEELDWRTMLEFFRDTLPGADASLPVFGAPGDPHAALAKVASAIGLGSLLPFDEGQAYMGQQDMTAAMDKAKAHLDLSPRPFRAEVERYAPALA